MAMTTDIKLTSSVRQESGFKSANVGESVTLRCFYEGDVAAMIFWYKQTLGQEPRLISSFYKHDTKGTFSEEFKDNPRFTLETKNATNHLTISNLVPSDSATYYCISCYAYNFEFAEGATLSVKGSGLNVQAFVHQSASETIQPGGSMTCTVHTGTCDGEHSVYWFRNSEESQPGLIYTNGGRNDQCEKKSNTSTCVYNLPMETLDRSHTWPYYCAVATCGNILFGNGTKFDVAAEKDNSPDSLVYFLSGGLAFTTILSVLLTISVYKMNKRSCQCSDSQRVSASTTTNPEGNHCEDNLHYAALRVHKANRSRKQRDDLRTECVYSGVMHQY
uniref:uncharacterized protein n=1 Tax=Semicossyphus pulcher TaxID=241346 RepID=UPI0037E931E6